MEHQFRRGIYRPNAQRLSISLAPLVAQRSLLFRVKADLATKTSYGQLSPTTDESESDSESPALFLLTPAGIRVASAVASAMSTASVYSQDSWKGKSPFGPFLAVDTRRHAIAFSPSLQWSDLSEEDNGNEYLAEQPRYLGPVSALSTVTFQEDFDTELDSIGPVTTVALSVEVATKSPIPQINVILESQETNTIPQIAKLKKKKPEDSTTKRASKHSKAFGKVISRLSLQPSKKGLADRRRTEIATNPMPELKLPRLPELQLADPIRMSFIAKSSGCMLSLQTTVEVQATIEEQDDTLEKDCQPAERSHLVRSTLPPTTPFEKRSLAPPPITLPSTIPPTRPTKGHKRYRSSPAVMNFDFRRWDAEKMPPLPVIPSSLKVSIPTTTITTTPVAPVRTRSRSIINRGVHGI